MNAPSRSAARAKYALKLAVGLVIMGFLVAYLWEHREELWRTFNFDTQDLLVLFFLFVVRILLDTAWTTVAIRALGPQVGFGEMLVLRNTAVLLNHAPMKPGTVLRAVYLKRLHGLDYPRFAAFFMFMTFLYTFVSSSMALASFLLPSSDLSQVASQILLLAFAAGWLGSGVVLFVPLPSPSGDGRIRVLVRSLLQGRKVLSQNPRVVIVCGLILSVNACLGGLWYWLLLTILGYPPLVGGVLVLGCLGGIIDYVSFTPAALGIREALTGAATLGLAIPLQIGVAVAMLERAVSLSFVVVVGLPALLWLTSKNREVFQAIRPSQPSSPTAEAQT